MKFVQLCHLVCSGRVWQCKVGSASALRSAWARRHPCLFETNCIRHFPAQMEAFAHTHTQHTLHAYTILHLHLHSDLRLRLHTHTQQQWQGDQPSSDPRKEARWKRSGSGKGPSKPINKPNMPVSTSQRARNIHSMSFHRAFRLFLCLCVCSFLWCSHI